MKRLLLTFGLACAAFCPVESGAQTAFTADEVKAGFLYHFAAFVNWPEAVAADLIVIGILGGDEVESELRRIVAAKRAQGKSITVRRLRPGDDLAGIHILYVGASESQRLERVVAAVRGEPTLVVSDTPEGLERGAMINFVTTDRVQFEISLDSAHRGGLRLSPRLLSVAVRVKKSGLAHGAMHA
jgi:hypothetical protein